MVGFLCLVGCVSGCPGASTLTDPNLGAAVAAFPNLGAEKSMFGTSSVLEPLRAAERLVSSQNACALPGCSIKYDMFMTILRRAMSRGYVKDVYGKFVEDGLTNGFTLGVDRSRLHGRRVFRNYKSAYEDVPSLTSSILERVSKGKTLALGAWDAVKAELDLLFADYYVFPMGSVPKPHQPEVRRATSDHTKTGFNAATVMGILGHSLDTYKQVAWLLKKDYFMYVSDVSDAFMIIPLAPWLWIFFLFRWFAEQGGKVEITYAHIFGDFGTRGLPGTFRIFLVEVVVQMARSEFVLTLPLLIYVDDVAIPGQRREQVRLEMKNFQAWSALYCGLAWKVLKDKSEAQNQLYIGFWWNSKYFTRTLDEVKINAYLDELAAAGSAAILTLRERQSLAGKMQRIIMTLPPGAACLLVNCYVMMARLSLPWHARRTTRAERDDYLFVKELLTLNLGRGYYSYDGFKQGPEGQSDASKSRAYSGGGYLFSDGVADYFQYGSSASRHSINVLEGDVVLRACMRRGHRWFEMLIPFGIDNRGFQLAAAKGRSSVPTFNAILRGLFATQTRYSFILQPYWLSTTDNWLADCLSRNKIELFLRDLEASGFLDVPFASFEFFQDVGRVVTMELYHERDAMAALRQLLDTYSSNNLKDGPNRGHGIGGDAQLISISYPYSTIYQGLPPEFERRVDEIMDTRLAPGSKSKMMTGFNRWQAFAEARGWSPLIKTGFEDRGGRLIAWVTSMVDETELVYSSISTYVWGVATWHVLQHQADPRFGLMHWREFMSGVAVLTAVPAEPRQMVPLETLRSLLEDLDDTDFRQAQLGLVLIVLLFTFSRTECPCPKAWTGPQVFDQSVHWTDSDFKLVLTSGQYVLWVRFKGIKQDKRMERPSARTKESWLPFDDEVDGFGHDWVPLGDVDDDLFSVRRWYMAFVRALGKSRSPDEPMFLAADKERPYTYSCLMTDFRHWLGRVGGDVKLGPHGLRVLGYNLSLRGNGEDLTGAHGGWLSSAHSRYARFERSDVLGVTAGMLGVPSLFEDAPREIARARSVRHPVVPALPVDGGDAASDDADVESEGEPDGRQLLPPGYSEQWRVSRPSGRRYPVYVGPSGVTLHSRVQAWAEYHSRQSPVVPLSAEDDDVLLLDESEEVGELPRMGGSPRPQVMARDGLPSSRTRSRTGSGVAHRALYPTPWAQGHAL